MRHAVTLFVALAGALQLGYLALGYRAVFEIGFGAVFLLGMLISGTFLWLWAERTTPLALGMAMSWAGAGLLIGWWWLASLFDHPAAMARHPMLFNFLALYLVGAVLHLMVIHRSFTAESARFLVPLLASAATAWAISLAF